MIGIPGVGTTANFALGDKILVLFFTGQLPNTTEFGLFLEIALGTLVLLQGGVSLTNDTGRLVIKDSTARGEKLLNKHKSLLQ